MSMPDEITASLNKVIPEDQITVSLNKALRKKLLREAKNAATVESKIESDNINYTNKRRCSEEYEENLRLSKVFGCTIEELIE